MCIYIYIIYIYIVYKTQAIHGNVPLPWWSSIDTGPQGRDAWYAEMCKHMPGKESNWMGASGQVIPGWIAKWLGKGDLSDATSMFRFFLHDV